MRCSICAYYALYDLQKMVDKANNIMMRNEKTNCVNADYGIQLWKRYSLSVLEALSPLFVPLFFQKYTIFWDVIRWCVILIISLKASYIKVWDDMRGYKDYDKSTVRLPRQKLCFWLKHCIFKAFATWQSDLYPCSTPYFCF